MKKTVSILYLALLLTGTLVAVAQPITTLDAIQNLKLSQVEDLAVANGKRIDVLTANLADLRSSVDTSRAWIIGFGSCLSVLHLWLTISVRKQSGGNGNGSGYRLKDKY